MDRRRRWNRDRLRDRTHVASELRVPAGLRRHGLLLECGREPPHSATMRGLHWAVHRSRVRPEAEHLLVDNLRGPAAGIRVRRRLLQPLQSDQFQPEERRGPAAAAPPSTGRASVRCLLDSATRSTSPSTSTCSTVMPASRCTRRQRARRLPTGPPHTSASLNDPPHVTRAMRVPLTSSAVSRASPSPAASCCKTGYRHSSQLAASDR